MTDARRAHRQRQSHHPACIAALPANAVAIVELVEQRRGETVVPVLARETIAWRGAEAQKFAIRFDPSLVRPAAFYALRARIVADGAVWFETQYPQLIAPLSGDQQTLSLTRERPRIRRHLAVGHAQPRSAA